MKRINNEQITTTTVARQKKPKNMTLATTLSYLGISNAVKKYAVQCRVKCQFPSKMPSYQVLCRLPIFFLGIFYIHYFEK